MLLIMMLSQYPSHNQIDLIYTGYIDSLAILIFIIIIFFVWLY